MLAGQGKSKKQGGLETRKRRSFRILLGIWIVGFLALVVGGAFAVYDVRSTASAAVIPAPAPVIAAPQVAAVTDSAPAPSPAGLAAALGAAVTNPGLGAFTGSVTDTATGTVLWSHEPERPMTPASTTKLLTAAAALVALPSDHRITTEVVSGSRPGEVVLVAGGDPTLTAQPVGQDGFYPGAPRIADLADQVSHSGTAVDTVLVDIGVYSGDPLAPGWFPEDVPAGFVAPMEPVMLDGGRSDPLEDESPRSETPALDAGRALAVALGADPAGVALGSAAPDATPMASVQSAPLRDRLGQMVSRSDNVLAEAIGREVAIDAGAGASFSDAVGAVLRVLQGAGFDTSGVTLADLSGLSVDDRIPAGLLDSIMAAAASPDREDLRPILDHLPVAGGTGTLADRYGTVNRAGAGWVRAKTGTLDLVSGLSGYVVDTDGRVLSFALLSNDRSPGEARPALDAVAAVLRECGCR
ncbi:D-alanyl-D-alanine carboxypeptidase/D-alanyl-D-alanine endopeptidase [Rhodococcus artemisiae]|uniref:D-alanyl-D-alanine carboxypeptidase/D-alanyl-D-alanine-endopeptidase n=1 Tax=Rhodococcus artemisiae TaxID=714159 RepID=A0ABU7LAZ5_9NOCA|nr:D-alanyl-D-alanine carboxypeptidase/D-alanyl-D-alanine-endopeptidase [Rhodococcus artemisiae]MEE2058711.1 D-alanyl-D-alanine carboxypeptidase/D-alanyl-D-alanine-endopeptidase [Rhodococcus artemisiae]